MPPEDALTNSNTIRDGTFYAISQHCNGCLSGARLPEIPRRTRRRISLPVYGVRYMFPSFQRRRGWRNARLACEQEWNRNRRRQPGQPRMSQIGSQQILTFGYFVLVLRLSRFSRTAAETYVQATARSQRHFGLVKNLLMSAISAAIGLSFANDCSEGPGWGRRGRRSSGKFQVR